MTNDKFEELAERVATHMCGIHAMHHLYHDDEITENMLNGLLAIQVMQGVELNWGVKELTAVAKSVSDDLIDAYQATIQTDQEFKEILVDHLGIDYKYINFNKALIPVRAALHDQAENMCEFIFSSEGQNLVNRKGSGLDIDDEDFSDRFQGSMR
tara:strand:+ start:6743 stop:7207 length:465 start_codon:yes stop_codon:yes gene_type:complete